MALRVVLFPLGVRAVFQWRLRRGQTMGDDEPTAEERNPKTATRAGLQPALSLAPCVSGGDTSCPFFPDSSPL